jgi:tetratricopeptide (TPR) repeat protein
MGKHAQLPALGRAPEAADAGARRIPLLQTRYFAFLSYSHKDKELADWLHRELERFRVPRSLAGRLTANGIVPKRLTPIFRDEHDLAAAGDLGGEIKAALAVSQYLIVLCSPTAAASRWTNAEIDWFKRDRPEGCVLAAIAAGEPFASEIEGRESEECFPPALRQKYDRRGRPTNKRAEPLAADFRADGEARRTAFLKLVAGMLGVGLDELVQREQTRRHRRLGYLAAASLAGMAVTSTLSVIAIQSRDAARDQRRQAEGLVEFMVGDLRDKLEPIGKLDVLDGVGSRVLAYYSKQDTSQLTDDALLQRSRALNLMAGVAYDRGNLKEAEGLYRQAVAGTAEAVRRSPDDPKRLYEHAQNVFYVGEVARVAGRPNQAEAAYREYKAIADKMAAIEPDNLKYRMEVLYAGEDVGISLYDQHRFAEAQRLFENAASPMEKLASLYPGNTTYQKELSTALAWVADAQRSQGRLDAAIATRERQVAILDRLLGTTNDSNVEARLVWAHQGLGNVLMEHGETDRGIAELRSAADQAERLMPVEPRNADWKSTGARAHLDLAIALLSLGRRDEAAGQTAAGCALAAGLPASFAVSARARLETDCTALRARIALAGSAAEQAFVFAGQALAFARRQQSEDPATVQYRIAQVYRLAGDIRQRAGDGAGAKDAWNAGLAQLTPNVTERPWEMNERAELLRRLGRSEEATPLASHLASMSFHPMN